MLLQFKGGARGSGGYGGDRGRSAGGPSFGDRGRDRPRPY